VAVKIFDLRAFAGAIDSRETHQHGPPGS